MLLLHLSTFTNTLFPQPSVTNNIEKFTPEKETVEPVTVSDSPVVNAAKELKKPPLEPKIEASKPGDHYPWENIGAFNEGKKFDSSFIAGSHRLKAYITENYYADIYWNTSLIIFTCFFSWLIARWRFGIFGLVMILLTTASVYRAEFRRFKRDIRDDIQRDYAVEQLEKNFESMEWLNNFLAKFWVIYMPALSDTVKTTTNQVLKDVAPGFGIEALTLDEFTLGSKAPKINSIKSYPKIGKDLVEMDWAFSFTPNDTSDMTKIEIDKKINPKVALGVRVGKAFISKNLPILVEDMSISGRIKIKLSLSLNFPHIKIVSLQLLEPPKIDFALKPVGGDTFGLDIMSLIPGLSTLITTLINSNVGPMLYAPNHLDIDVEEIMKQQAKEAIGVIAVTVKNVSDLKETINPYVQVTLQNEPNKSIRTDVKAQTKDPNWGETKYILVNSLDQALNFELFDFNINKKKGELHSTHEFDLNELLQKDSHFNLEKQLNVAGKKKATIVYDIRWFPALDKHNSNTDEENLDLIDSETGIFKFTLHQAKGLDSSLSLTGQLNPKAELYINGALSKTFRTMKNANEPSWEESIEVLVSQKATTQVKLVLTDTTSGSEIGTLKESLDTLVFNVSQNEDEFKLSTQGEVRLSANFKPVSLSGVSSNGRYTPPVGVVRLHLRNAKDLLNLETVGDVDPYAKVLLANRLKYKTAFHPDTRNPEFNEVTYIPIVSSSQQITIEVMDDQNLTKDRPLGSVNIPVSNLFKKSPNGSLLFYDGANTILKSQLSLKNKKPKGEIYYSISFLPTIPVYSPPELKELKQKESQIAARKEKQENELKAWEELYKKAPKDYEWIEVEDISDEDDGTKKEQLSLTDLLSYRSGVLSVHFESGSVRKADSYIQVLIDDYASPSFVSSRTSTRDVNPEVGDAFIRDLPNSRIIFRNTKKPQIRETEQIIEENAFNTIDLLQKAYNKSTTIDLGSSQLKVRFEYVPSAIKLPPSESILDTGRAKIEFLDGENLPSHDSNGKSDPFITVELGEIELFKSKIVKKTLSPVWNESITIPIPSRSRTDLMLNVYDWDRAGKNDLLCKTKLDISSVEQLKTELVTFELKPQGIVRANVTFKPEYIRPKVGSSEFGLNLSGLAGAPLKGVGVAADLAVGGVGATVGAVGAVGSVGAAGVGAVGAGVGSVTTGALGAVGKTGGSLFKNVLSKKSKQSFDQPRPSMDTYASDVQSLRSGVKQPARQPSTSNLNNNSTPKHSRTPSDFSTYTTAAKGKRTSVGQLIIRNGEGLGNHAQLKVSLAVKGKLKHFFSTKNVKANAGVIRWDEETTFDAPQDAEIVFGGVVHRTLAKDQELGSTSVRLADIIDNPRDLTLNLGQGQIVVNFKYSPEPLSQVGTPVK